MQGINPLAFYDSCKKHLISQVKRKIDGYVSMIYMEYITILLCKNRKIDSVHKSLGSINMLLFIPATSFEVFQKLKCLSPVSAQR